MITAHALALLPDAERRAFMESLTPAEKEELFYRWEFWARPSQLLPKTGAFCHLALAGRGWGKTRVAAEWVRAKAADHAGCRIALVGRTAADVRDTIVEGESGILAVCATWEKPVYEPSKRRLTWPNGSRATCYSGDKPDLLRGPQHHFALADELAAWRYAEAAWSNLLMGLRLGDDPQVVVATTPRPIKIIKDLVKAKTTRVVRGTTYDNLSNLADTFRDTVVAQYEGTRLGRQELDGAILDDTAGALWTHDLIQASRVKFEKREYKRIVVAVDPAISTNKDSDETGIVVAALGTDGHAYVLDDLSCKETPAAWAAIVVKAYHDYKADRIIAETNQGGQMVEHVLRTVDSSVSYKAVHAKQGKKLRAEPVAALYEQRKVHHVGVLAALEDQMATWSPADTDSPDRVDALVYALTELMLGGKGETRVVPCSW